MTCNKCNKYNRRNSNFCRYCGEPLVSEKKAEQPSECLYSEENTSSSEKKKMSPETKKILIVLFVIVGVAIGVCTFGIGLIPMGILATHVLRQNDIFI